MMTRVNYTGSTPGTDSDTYVLFSTVAAFTSKNMLPMHGYKRYALHLTHSHNGTVNWYVSDDRGTNWRQVGTEAITAASNEGTWVDILIEGFQDFKVEWVNGGTAQSPWIVDQSLDTDRSAAA